MTVFRTYAAALLPAVITLLGALQLAIADNIIDETEAGQLIVTFAGVVITYLVPVFDGKWRGLFKTGFSVLAAVGTLIVPLVTGFTWTALVIFGLALLNAVATEIGVQIRDVPAPPAPVTRGRVSASR